MTGTSNALLSKKTGRAAGGAGAGALLEVEGAEAAAAGHHGGGAGAGAQWKLRAGEVFAAQPAEADTGWLCQVGGGVPHILEAPAHPSAAGTRSSRVLGGACSLVLRSSNLSPAAGVDGFVGLMGLWAIDGS